MNNAYRVIPPRQRQRFTAAAFAVMALAVSLMSILPWYYPSSTLLYKFGLDRILLMAGKSTGISLAVLLVLQMVLIARFHWIERRICQNRQITLHRYIGGTMVALPIIHPMLVFAPEDLKTIPVSIKYWPEVLGAALLLTFLTTAIFTKGRDFIRLPHGLWKTIHRYTAAVLMAGLVIHALFVNDGYTSGLPRYVLFGCTGVFGILWIKVLARPFLRSNPHRVVSVTKTGQDAVALTMQPLSGRHLVHAPGQFAYLRVHSKAVSKEEHPFTIASSPNGMEGLSITIRCAGDWTNQISQIKVGDNIFIDGPYGIFTTEAYPDWKELILIAGGVGITPFLSTLRYVSKTKNQRKILLIWSNRTPAHIVHMDEIDGLTTQLPDFHLYHFFSKQTESGDRKILDADQLGKIVGPFQCGKLVFLCGPEGFMKKRHAELKSLGYHNKVIKTERFHM